MNQHNLRLLGYLLVGGLYVFPRFRYGNAPGDLVRNTRGIRLWLMTTVWGLCMFDFFLEQPDRLPLVVLQLFTVLLVEASVLLSFANRENKAKRKVWGYTASACVAVLVVLSCVHLMQH